MVGSVHKLSLPPPPPYRLTAGTDNILLHYLCVEAGQGVWLGPAHHNSSLYGTVHHEMITCFQTTCTAIRAILVGQTQVGDLSMECNCGFVMIFMTLNSQDEEEESDDEWNGDSEEEGDDKEDKVYKITTATSDNYHPPSHVMLPSLSPPALLPSTSSLLPTSPWGKVCGAWRLAGHSTETLCG